MKAAWLALREGFRRVRRYWPAVLVAYAVNLLSAVALALLPAAGLLQAAQRPALEQAARGISAGMVVDLLGAVMANVTMGSNPDAQALQLGLWWVLVVAAVLPFAAGLPAAFLNGGLMLTYIEAPTPWRWRRFVWGCWHWFGPFLMLGLGQALLTSLAATVAAVLMGLAAATRMPWAVWVVAALLAAVVAASLALFEVAGVWMVSRSSRNFARALGAALRYAVGQAAPLAALYAMTLAGLGLAHVFYNWALWPRLPLAVWPVVLIVQQGFILLRLVGRLLRLSACAALVHPLAIESRNPISMPMPSL